MSAPGPRFYLPTVPELANANFGQVIVMTKDLDARERVFADLEQALARRCPGGAHPGQPLQNGPPVASR